MAEEIADRLNLPETTREGSKKRAPTTLQDHIVEAPLNETSTGGLDEYVQDIYQILEKASAELCKRFDEKNTTMIRGITALCPTSNSFLDVRKLIEFADTARNTQISQCF